MIKLMDVHNHTTWSDGWHTPKEIIENAINNGVSTIGISDHFHTIKCNSIKISNLQNYIDEINKLKAIYKDKIEVLVGVEICMNKEWCSLDTLPYEILNKLDYALFEYIDWFVDSVTLKEISQYASQITCKKGLAHSNIFALITKYGIDSVMKYLKENNLFWEINVNEGYEYFDEILQNKEDEEVKYLFANLKKNNIEVSIGSDTHHLIYYDIERIKMAHKLLE